MSCVQNEMYGTIWDIEGVPYYDDRTGLPCFPSGPGQSAPSNFPYPVKINTNTGGAGGVTGGQTTLDKLLATLTSIYALNQRAPYVPTTAQPVQQNYGYGSSIYGGGNNDAYLALLAQGRSSGTGASLGAGIEDLIQNNKGILLIAGAMVVLLFIKPPSRRNGINNPRRRKRARR